MSGNRQLNTVGLSDMAPNIVILPPINIDKSRNFVLRRPLTRDRSRNIPNTAPVRPESRDEVSVDLISVTSDDYQKNDDIDRISFEEGRLQQWNLAEFQMQVLGAVAGMVLLFGCGLISAWAITDLIRDLPESIDDIFDFITNEDRDTFLESRHVTIAMVVLSYNVGCIVGAILGAFVTPLLPNRLIYIIGSVLMLFTSLLLPMHTSAFNCARSRLVAGLLGGLMQVTLLVQAAESTTKKVRRWMLIVFAHVNALSTFASTLIFYYHDGRPQVTYTENNRALIIVSYLMGGCAVAVLILNFLFTKDTIPFHLMRGEDATAFEEMSRLKSDYLSMVDIRYEYDRIRFDVKQSQIDANRNLAARSNHKPIISLCCVNILNLVFTSVPITLILILIVDDEVEIDFDSMQPQEIQKEIDYETRQLLMYVIICQASRILCSIALMFRKDKYHYNRTCYKFTAIVGATLIFWSLFYMIWYIEILEYIPQSPFKIVILMGYMSLPIPLNIIQLNQSADLYAQTKNTWLLAFAIFVENIVHICLIVQLDMFFKIAFIELMNGLILVSLSYWLLRNMPNVVSICPIVVAIATIKSPTDGSTIHI